MLARTRRESPGLHHHLCPFNSNNKQVVLRGEASGRVWGSLQFSVHLHLLGVRFVELLCLPAIISLDTLRFVSRQDPSRSNAEALTQWLAGAGSWDRGAGVGKDTTAGRWRKLAGSRAVGWIRKNNDSKQRPISSQPQNSLDSCQPNSRRFVILVTNQRQTSTNTKVLLSLSATNPNSKHHHHSPFLFSVHALFSTLLLVRRSTGSFSFRQDSRIPATSPLHVANPVAVASQGFHAVNSLPEQLL